MILLVALTDRGVVDAGDLAAHQTALVELPKLGAIAFIGKTDGDVVFAESVQLPDKTIVEFPMPFAGEESDDWEFKAE